MSRLKCKGIKKEDKKIITIFYFASSILRKNILRFICHDSCNTQWHSTLFTMRNSCYLHSFKNSSMMFNVPLQKYFTLDIDFNWAFPSKIYSPNKKFHETTLIESTSYLVGKLSVECHQSLSCKLMSRIPALLLWVPP